MLDFGPTRALGGGGRPVAVFERRAGRPPRAPVPIKPRVRPSSGPAKADLLRKQLIAQENLAAARHRPSAGSVLARNALGTPNARIPWSSVASTTSSMWGYESAADSCGSETGHAATSLRRLQSRGSRCTTAETCFSAGRSSCRQPRHEPARLHMSRSQSSVGISRVSSSAHLTRSHGMTSSAALRRIDIIEREVANAVGQRQDVENQIKELRQKIGEMSRADRISATGLSLLAVAAPRQQA